MHINQNEGKCLLLFLVVDEQILLKLGNKILNMRVWIGNTCEHKSFLNICRHPDQECTHHPIGPSGVTSFTSTCQHYVARSKNNFF